MPGKEQAAQQAAEQQHGINEGNDAIAVHFGSSLLLAEWDWFLQGESAGRRPGGGAADAGKARISRPEGGLACGYARVPAGTAGDLRPDPVPCGNF